MMRIALLLFMSANAFAFMSASEARLKATRERLLRERACHDGFREDLERQIDIAVSRDEHSVDSECYTCHHGLYALRKKLEKNGYKITLKICGYYPNTKYMRVEW